MDKSSRYDNIPIQEQVRPWDSRNAAARKDAISPAAARRAEAVGSSVAAFGRTYMAIVGTGRATGWLCERLQKFGRTTGVDLSDQILERARARLPDVTFMSENLFQIDLPPNSFDVVVTLEARPRVQDQQALVGQRASLRKPDELLIFATQNRAVSERWSVASGPSPGQIRRSSDTKTFRTQLASRFNTVEIAPMFPVGDRGFPRIVCSPKLNALVALVLPAGRLEGAKERSMLGHAHAGACARRAGSVAVRRPRHRKSALLRFAALDRPARNFHCCNPA